MYLKALEIQGFKSFPEKTRLSFEKDITAIVGPNGSGKSNISDAILWVMGEQRSKTLRGNKMEDVIFGGTEKRNPLGFAQVSLVIDNSSRVIDSDSNEIMLTRRYYRSGESEYSINRETVRLKDIHSLLMDTGLGRDGYSIIGQGRIAEIVSTKSLDRREIFEEAAGISRFRYRKEEAEKKLEKTDDNLLRINDKIDELELQIGPLKEQSEVARRYLQLQDERKISEVSAWMATLDKLHEQTNIIRQEYEEISKNLEKTKSELEAIYASSENLAERMHRKDVESEQTRERLRGAEATAAEYDAKVAVLRTNVQNSRQARDRLVLDLEEQSSRVEEIRSAILDGESRLSQIKDELKSVQLLETHNSNVLEGCRMKLQNREDHLARLTDRVNGLSVELRSVEGSIRLYSEMEKEYEGYSHAVRTVMREAERGNLKGIHGPVANLVRSAEEHTLAIETALGGASQNIVTDSQNEGRYAIEMLHRTDSGRARFLPLDTIRGKVMKDVPVNDPGFVGLAYDLVSFDPAYEQIMANLLGRTIVAERLSDAIRISRRNGNHLRIVTLDGQMIHDDGSMTGGSNVKNAGFLSRANKLETLKKEKEELSRKTKDAVDELDRARSAQNAVRYQLDLALEEQTELKSKRSSFETELRTTENTVKQFSVLLKSITGDREIKNSAIQAADRQIADFSDRLKEEETRQERAKEAIKGIREEIDRIAQSKLDLEGKRTRAEKEAQARNAEILELEKASSRIEQRKLAAEMEEKQILDRLWETYELSHTAAQALRRPVDSLPKLNRRIEEIKKEMLSLGTPNLGAIDEYVRVNERYSFLTDQRSDIETAKQELTTLVREITSEMESVFKSQFHAIDAAFRDTFLEMFNGGKAALVLEDPVHVLDCGIDIKVQPPGKTLSTISLLSGGEMAFVAIALYFAILKVRPTPFCVMDEIEAALDEANVSRFAAYLRRMSVNTQFLVITHRRGTMEEADMLYGVTMQEKGVSTVLELDLESAEKTLEG